MADKNTLAAVLDKTVYIAGETMKLTIVGSIVRTSDVTWSGASVNFTASDGQTYAAQIPGATIVGGMVVTITPTGVVSVTDASGRKWTVAADGKSATAIA